MDSEFNIKAMPSAIMAEKSVLSSAIRNTLFLNRAKAEGIDVDCFYHPDTKNTWLAICAHAKEYPESNEIDLGLMIQKLNIAGNLEKCGGMSGLANIWGYAPTDGSFSQWCDILREMKAQRLAKTFSTVLDECEDAQEAILATQNALETLRKTITGKQRSNTSKAAAHAFLEKFQNDHQAGDIPGMSTGITEIDKICGGMKPGELWVIGGKPSMGKSVLMLQIAEAFITRGDKSVVFSLEMMQSEIIGRFVTLCGRVKYSSITQPRLATSGDLSKIKLAIKKIAESPLWIDASAGQSIDTIINEAEMIRDRDGDLKLIVVDYLQLIRGGRARGESREEEVARVSGGLKQLAKRLSCPVLTASQLNEDGKTRESRAIEQDADALIGIMDDGLKIGKMRNGKKGETLKLYLNGEMQRFTEIQPFSR